MHDYIVVLNCQIVFFQMRMSVLTTDYSVTMVPVEIPQEALCVNARMAMNWMQGAQFAKVGFHDNNNLLLLNQEKLLT